MAVRPQHVHDGGIVERRLRPIYDWLDNGNNKKALQEAEKVLKKSPTLQAARALKALALLRLGKNSEAKVVLDALADEKPSDDTTLQAMTISYRETQQLPKVCAIYEAAVKSEPNNEELYTHLFMSYVRVADYKSQQRAAMALYKIMPKNPYYFWAVMSVVMQAKTTEDATKKGILLSLAQRLTENFISENKIEGDQEIRLYIMILELQEKWEDILKFIESPLYSKIIPRSVAQDSIPYLKKLGQWRKLNMICKELLYDNHDRWDYYLPYFDSVFELIKSGSSGDDAADDTAEKCHEFICQLVESMSGKAIRGPYLARLELWKRLSAEGDPTTLLGSGVALCVQYLRIYANKPCAVPDLRPYIAMLPQKEREDRCREFLTCLGMDENSQPESIEDIQRHVSCIATWRLAAAPLAAKEALDLANTLRRHYTRSLQEGLVTATPTEFCAADSYGILAAHHFFYAAVQKQNSAPVIEALCLLELVLHHSPANFHAKLLLIQLYHILGNALAADSIYYRLEVKHIQLVSLGWLHAARLAPACASTRALQLLADTRAFHSHHGKDGIEHVTFAYKYGTFDKLVELVEWNSRIEACGWCARGARERALCSLLAGPPAPLHAPSRLPTTPTDNRDLNVIVNYEPHQCQDTHLKTKTFEQDKAYLCLKDALVSCIALCIELADNRNVEEKRAQYEELVSCIEAYSTAMAKCRDIYTGKEKISISTPFPSRIIAFVSSPVPYRELYTTTLSMVAELSVGNAGQSHKLCERVCSLVGQAQGLLGNEVALEGDPGWVMRDALEKLANYLEFIGVITFLLGVCNELIAPTNAKRPKKKTNQSPDDQKTSESLNSLNETVQRTIAYIEEMLEKWPNYNFETNFEEDLSKLTLESYQSPVENKLRNGREDMLNDLRNILKKKSKYLKSLLQ